MYKWNNRTKLIAALVLPIGSAIELYEDGKRLGPAHSTLDDISKFGNGRFSHRKKGPLAIYFSSSDNSDPNTNKREYWIVRPPRPTPIN